MNIKNNESLILGENIKKYRQLRGLKQCDFATMLQVDPSTVTKWEKGTREPNLSLLLNISDILSVSLLDLLGISSILSANENMLIDYFRSLNEEGQEKLLEQAEFFVSSGKYIQSHKSKLVQAK